MENDDWISANIQGAKAFIDWFEGWPSFHDAEIIELHLSRRESSWIKIHTWKNTDEVDAEGYFVSDKNAVVTFRMTDVQGLELNDFSGQNVIFALGIGPTDEGVELRLEPCFGLSGRILAACFSIEFEPGLPQN
jgi:hypothetical protein